MNKNNRDLFVMIVLFSTSLMAILVGWHYALVWKWTKESRATITGTMYSEVGIVHKAPAHAAQPEAIKIVRGVDNEPYEVLPVKKSHGHQGSIVIDPDMSEWPNGAWVRHQLPIEETPPQLTWAVTDGEGHWYWEWWTKP